MTNDIQLDKELNTLYQGLIAQNKKNALNFAHVEKILNTGKNGIARIEKLALKLKNGNDKTASLKSLVSQYFTKKKIKLSLQGLGAKGSPFIAETLPPKGKKKIKVTDIESVFDFIPTMKISDIDALIKHALEIRSELLIEQNKKVA